MTDEIDQIASDDQPESPVLKALRIANRELEKDLKARPTREDLEIEIRAQLKRESDVAALLTEQGPYAGLAEFALTKIGDAEVTAEAVSGFLQGLGLAAQPVSAEADTSPEQSQQLADVTSLAGRVAAASSGATADSVMDRLSKTQNQREVEAIMAEIGAVQSQI